MATFGLLPTDVILNEWGVATSGTHADLYATQALADAGASGTSLSFVVTGAGGRFEYTNDALASVWARTLTGAVSEFGAPGAGAGGGAAPPGVSIVRAFPFAFDTPDILTGAAVYTPTVGDILMDAWIEVDTAWDGTTPLGDFGPFVSNSGWLSGAIYGAAQMNQGDSEYEGTLINGTCLSDLRTASILSAAQSALIQGSGTAVSTSSTGPGGLTLHGSHNVPAKFTAADPIKVCVSQDGTNTGADPASTQGAGVLYLVTATPA